MVSITLSVPEEIKHKMEKFQEVNWSGFIRKAIIQKAEELSWKSEMLNKFEKEKEFNEWATNLIRKGRRCK